MRGQAVQRDQSSEPTGREGDANQASHTALRPIDVSPTAPSAAPAPSSLRAAALLQALADTLQVVVVTLDEHGFMTTPQPSWEGYTGQAFDRACGLGFFEVIHPDDWSYFAATWEAGLRSRAAFEAEARIACSAIGAFRSCRLKASPVTLDGNLAAWLVVLWDTTAPSPVGTEATALLARAEESRMEALRTLARGIAHQLNNLLHGLLIHAELIRRHLDAGSKAQGSLAHVLRSTQRGAEFGRQLLAFAGRKPSPLESCDLSRVVESMRPALLGTCTAGAHLSFELAEHLPAVDAGPAQLGEVILSLVTNAFEALPGGAGSIRVSTGVDAFSERALQGARPAGLARPGRYAYVEVLDDGVGMSPELIARVFEPFFANKYTGRGLGLPLVLGIVRSWGGLVDLSSEPGHGTRVRILLPAPATP